MKHFQRLTSGRHTFHLHYEIESSQALQIHWCIGQEVLAFVTLLFVLEVEVSIQHHCISPLQESNSSKCLEACHAYVSIIFAAGHFGPTYHSWPWTQIQEPGRFKSRVVSKPFWPDLPQQDTKHIPLKGPLIPVFFNFQMKVCPHSESRTNSSKEKGEKMEKEEVEEGRALPLSQSQVIWARKGQKCRQAGRLGNCSSTTEDNAFLA